MLTKKLKNLLTKSILMAVFLTVPIALSAGPAAGHTSTGGSGKCKHTTVNSKPSGKGKHTTVNCVPVARAGPDQAAYVGDTIDLDGSGSSDADGDALSFDWQLISKPAGSVAVLSSNLTVLPSFFLDTAGTYEIELIVHDGTATSAPDIVKITTENVAPVADAGADLTTSPGTTVQLDGKGSNDANGDELKFNWPHQQAGS